jgi:hypothetical protein
MRSISWSSWWSGAAISAASWIRAQTSSDANCFQRLFDMGSPVRFGAEGIEIHLNGKRYSSLPATMALICIVSVAAFWVLTQGSGWGALLSIHKGYSCIVMGMRLGWGQGMSGPILLLTNRFGLEKEG